MEGQFLSLLFSASAGTQEILVRQMNESTGWDVSIS